MMVRLITVLIAHLASVKLTQVHATRRIKNGAEASTEIARMRSQQRQMARDDVGHGRRQLQRTIQEFCSNLTDLELFLTDGFMDIFSAPDEEPPSLVPESGYQCACSVPGEDPSLRCTLNYTWPDDTLAANETQEYYINTEQAEFTTTTVSGIVYYVPTTLGWCDAIDGIPESEHCEAYEFCDHDDDPTTAVQLCSCSTNQGDGCPTCDVCDDGITVALNCSAVGDESPFNYVTTCEDDNYAGPLLSGYRDKVMDIVSVVQEKALGATTATAASASSATTISARYTSFVRSAITVGCGIAILFLTLQS